jgi:hypothetical protein
MALFQYDEPGAPYPSAINLSGAGKTSPVSLYYEDDDVGQYAEGGLVAAAQKIRGAGRYGDSETIHINPEELEELTRMWGPPSINPETGMPEFFLKKVWKAVKKVAPIASLFIPVIGPALGTALGVGGIAGSALAGAALGGISGGAKGAVVGGLGGALAGGVGGKIGAMTGIKNPALANVAGNMIGGIGTSLVAGALNKPPSGGGGSGVAPMQPTAPTSGIGGLGMNDRLTYKPLAMEQNAYTFDPKTYGQTGGEFQFFKPYNFQVGTAPAGKAEGGEIDDPHPDTIRHLIAYAQGGGHQGPGQVRGIGSGQDDKIPAWLSDGEYVWSAQDVADLGDGSTDAGVRRLDQMRQMVRKQAGRKNVKSIAKPQRGIEQMLMAVGGAA